LLVELDGRGHHALGHGLAVEVLTLGHPDVHPQLPDRSRANPTLVEFERDLVFLLKATRPASSR
jgi:hypothetical protein